MRRESRSQRKVTSSGELIEIDEGIIADSKNVLVTNVTVHVVSPDEEKGILLRGTTADPIVFRVKENVAGAMIGRLLYNKNITRSKETPPRIRGKPMEQRKNRQMNSTKFNKNDTQFNSIPRNKRNNRDTAQAEFTVNVAPSILFEDFDPQDPFLFELEAHRRSPRATNKEEEVGFGSRRAQAQARPLKERRIYPSQQLRKRFREAKKFEPITGTPPTTLANPMPTYRPIGRFRVPGRLNDSIPVTEDVIEEVPPPKGISEMAPRKLSTPPDATGLRYIIANQQDVTDLITITNDGTLLTLKGLDREERDIYRLTIIAEYTRGHINGAGIYQVTIHVDDENDNPPVFNHGSYTGVISENSPLGTELIVNQPIMVKDKDAGQNAEVELSLQGEGSHLFKIELVNGTTDARNKSFMSSFDTFTSAMNIEKNFANLHMMFMDATIASMTADPHYIIRFVGPSILDRERENFYNLKMIARDSGGLSSEVKLGIFVADVNDNAPVFEKIAVFKNSGIKILEYTNEMEIYFVDHVDLNPLQLENKNNHSFAFKYEISPNLNPSPFSEGLKDMVDRYHIGTPRNIKIRNSTEKRDRRAPQPFQKRQTKKERSSSPLFAIMENTSVGQSVLKITASDEDDEGNAQVFYDLVTETFIPRKSNGKSPSSNSSPSIMKYFHIDRLSGELRVNRLLPAESEIRLNISARDVGNLMDYTQIRFRVIDVNDHSPVFQKPWYTFDIEEGIYRNTRVGRVEALDEDFGQNANVTYRILSEKKIPFVISPHSGVITVNGDVDRELQSSYEFKVIASDNSEKDPQLTAEAEIEITVLDLNDNAPEFTAYDELYTRRSGDHGTDRQILGEALDANQLQTPVYKAYINRNTEPGTFVKQVMAMDKDFAGNGNGLVMYSIMHHSKLPYVFEIDSRDGIITTVSKLNSYHGYEHMNMTIIASDLGSPTKSSTALLLVNLQGEDVYDEEEVLGAALKGNNVLPHKYYEVEVMENGPAPMKVLQLNVTKGYQNEQLKWSIVTEMEVLKYDIFTIDQDNGTLWVNRPLDRELQDFYKLRIRAEKVSREGRNQQMMMMSMNYPVEGERIQGLQENEARVSMSSRSLLIVHNL